MSENFSRPRRKIAPETAYQLIRSPIITEKSTRLSQSGQLVFKVALHANKREIAAAIEQLFGVEVVSVNTLIQKGKAKRFRGGPKGFRSDVKKALVRLAPGHSIDLTTGLA